MSEHERALNRLAPKYGAPPPPSVICPACRQRVKSADERIAALEREVAEARDVSYLKDQDRLRLQGERDEAHAAIRALDEAADFAYGALRDAVEDNLDRPAGFAVIRMIQDYRREHAPAIRRASEGKA